MPLSRVPLAVPYWSGITYRRALRSLVSLRIIEGSDLDELRRRLIARLDVRDALLCSSGSFALELALRWCGVAAGDEVVIPTFCCSAVVAPVLALGAQPVLADVGAELNLTVDTVAAALTRRTRAVIVPHLFGNPADIAGIVELARRKNIRVIDDAAQALGATLDGRPLGGWGDLGIVSFGAEKVCFGLGGGAVIARRDDFARRDWQLSPARPRAGAALAAFASTLLRRRWRRWTLPLYAVARKQQRDVALALQSYPRERMANLSAAVACSLLETLPANLAARRARVDAYRRLLGAVAGVELIAHRPGSACLTQVIRCPSGSSRRDRAAQVVAALGARGFEVQGSYVPIHLLENFSMCVWDHLPHADRVWSDLVELPCEPDVDLDAVEEIAAIVKATVID